LILLAAIVTALCNKPESSRGTFLAISPLTGETTNTVFSLAATVVPSAHICRLSNTAIAEEATSTARKFPLLRIILLEIRVSYVLTLVTKTAVNPRPIVTDRAEPLLAHAYINANER
jgi:hypothetical protein